MKPQDSVHPIVQDQRGMILPLVLVFLALGLLLLTPTLGLAMTSMTTGEVYESKTKEIHAADAGLERGIYAIKHAVSDEEIPGFNLNGCDVSVTVQAGGVTEDGVPIHEITSIASIGPGSSTIVNALVSGSADPTGTFDIGDPDVVLGNYEFDENTVFTDVFPGNLNGDVTVLQDVVVVFKGCIDGVVNGNFTGHGIVVYCCENVVWKGSAGSDMVAIFTGDLSLPNAGVMFQGTTIVQGNISGNSNAKIEGVLCCGGDIFDVNIDGVINQPVPTECVGFGGYPDFCSASEFEILIYEVT